MCKVSRALRAGRASGYSSKNRAFRYSCALSTRMMVVNVSSGNNGLGVLPIGSWFIVCVTGHATQQL